MSVKSVVSLCIMAASLAASQTGCLELAAAVVSSAADSSGDSKGPLKPGDSGYVDPGAYYGPVAEKRAGQVVFSAEPIAMAATNDSSVYASYELGEPLYIRYFGTDAPHNLLPTCASPRSILRVEVNGEYAGKPTARWESFGLYEVGDPNTRGAASLSNELELAFTTPSLWSPERAVAGEEVVRNFNSLVIPKLQVGANQIRVVVQLDCGSSDDSNPVVAKGDLTIIVAPGAIRGYLAMFGTRIGNSPHPDNAKLVPQIIKVMKSMADWDNEDFIGASVTSEEWLPIRHEYSGLVIAYRIDAALIVHSKAEADPEACRLFTMGYSKDAEGGPLRYAGTGDLTPFPCSNAPKLK